MFWMTVMELMQPGLLSLFMLFFRVLGRFEEVSEVRFWCQCTGCACKETTEGGSCLSFSLPGLE
ncbi:hypothetical protein M758_UG342300 [Ceratodon purpureus]|nr:hypothetical protein M758_UG342300 [Ceratodon purpureus]